MMRTISTQTGFERKRGYETGFTKGFKQSTILLSSSFLAQCQATFSLSIEKHPLNRADNKSCEKKREETDESREQSTVNVCAVWIVHDRDSLDSQASGGAGLGCGIGMIGPYGQTGIGIGLAGGSIGGGVSSPGHHGNKGIGTGGNAGSHIAGQIISAHSDDPAVEAAQVATMIAVHGTASEPIETTEPAEQERAIAAQTAAPSAQQAALQVHEHQPRRPVGSLSMRGLLFEYR